MSALNRYNRTALTQTPRESEAMALRLASRRLREASNRAGRNIALGLNHELWSIIFRDLNNAQNQLTGVLKADCLALALWSLNYTTRAVLSDLPVEPLIEVNDTLAEGLEAAQPAPAIRQHSPAGPVASLALAG